MIDFPNAKINLGLQITEKRPDGFHNLESIFFPVKVKDALEIIISDKTTMNIYGIPVDGDTSNNLCLRAYNLLKADFDLAPVQINLLKNIPTGAGMGGGSADGTFTLTLLNKLFSLDLTMSQLEGYALKLGSDCPFFLYNSPVLAQGRGEIITPLTVDLSGYEVKIVHPGIHISTKDAFSSIKPRPIQKSLAEIIAEPITEWKDSLVNDFESTVFPKFPILSEIKNGLYDKGAVYASMTGTGSAVYGVFNKGEGVVANDFPDFRVI